MSPKINFGTDGWRGILDKEVNEDTISAAAQAFSDYLINRSMDSVSVSFDGREKSGLFARIFAEVLSGNNIKTYLSAEITPTPILSYSVPAFKLSAGVMITASHNPCQYNGIKFKSSAGGPFTTEETLAVEELLFKNPVKRNNANIETADLIEVYESHIKSLIDFGFLKGSALVPLIDSMGGAGRKIISGLLSAAGINSRTIFGEPSATFYGRSAEPIEKNMLPLREALLKEDYSIGIATDGDADRAGFMDETGNYLGSQQIILLLADYLVNQKKLDGALVKTSSVTDKLVYFFESPYRKVFDVQVGFKYVSEKMIECDAAFGCEESGGYGFKGHIPERDGILTALLLIEMLASSGFTNISSYIKQKETEFEPVFYDRIDLKYDQYGREGLLTDIKFDREDLIGRFKIKDIGRFYSGRGMVNGLKFRFAGKSRWLLIRVSETEPMVRIYAEGDYNEEIKELLELGISIIKKG